MVRFISLLKGLGYAVPVIGSIEEYVHMKNLTGSRRKAWNAAYQVAFIQLATYDLAGLLYLDLVVNGNWRRLLVID